MSGHPVRMKAFELLVTWSGREHKLLALPTLIGQRLSRCRSTRSPSGWCPRWAYQWGVWGTTSRRGRGLWVGHSPCSLVVAAATGAWVEHHRGAVAKRAVRLGDPITGDAHGHDVVERTRSRCCRP